MCAHDSLITYSVNQICSQGTIQLEPMLKGICKNSHIVGLPKLCGYKAPFYNNPIITKVQRG